MDLDLLGVPGRAPLPAVVLVGPHELLFLGVHADHRFPGVTVVGGLGVEIGELRVPVRMLVALDRLGVALQAEPLPAQQLRDGFLAHLVPGRDQLRGELPGRHRGPAQRRLRIPAPARLHQPQQRRQQTRVGLGGRLTAPTRAADPAQRSRASLQFRHPVTDPRPRCPRRTRHRGNPAMTQRPGLTCQHQPLPPLIQMRQNRLELRPQRHHNVLTNGHTPLSDTQH